MNGYKEVLNKYQEEGRYRRIPEVRVDEDWIDLCTNDYMGLARNAESFRQEFHAKFGYPAMTSAASRLLSPYQKEFIDLENWLSDAYGKSALLFNSGYHVNTGLIQALNLPGTLWLTDKLIHASAIDGIRMAHAEYKRWNHNDVETLRRILKKESDNFERIIVVCESVYSMDGDRGPIAELCDLKKEFPRTMLYVDEAHAVGCFGRRGLGLCEEMGVIDEVDILVGTLGKACASTGAFVITSTLIKDFLINNARSFIFSTALAPINIAWSHFMLEKLYEMDKQRKRLGEISARVKSCIEKITEKPNPSQSPIIPIITGDTEKAITLSEILKENKILALPIRRPTVPPGGERVRLSLHADLSDSEVEHICNTLQHALS